jgi:glycosyltransferase involved in cell wall biosynthesis
LQNKYPLQVGFFYQKKRLDAIQKYIKTIAPNYVYCQLSRTALYGKDFSTYNVIDLQDAFSANYLRSISKSALLKKWFFKREYSTMCAFEEKMLQWFTHCTIISQFDKNQINSELANLHVVPNGVDTNYFLPKNMEKVYDILFIGNMSYEPNLLAAKYIYNQILPEIIKYLPNIKICIAGAHAIKACKYMNHKNLFIVGYTPDIREIYLSAKIFIAPLFTGAGMQNKILEAMSLALPCITTTLVNSSILAIHPTQIRIADTVSGFCEHIQDLLQKPILQKEIGIEARKYIVENFQWESVNEKLCKLFA